MRLKPDIYLNRVQDLDLIKLRQKGILVLVIDIDNTLIPPHSDVVSSPAITFIENVRKAGIEPVLISNNTKKRVSAIGKKLHASYYAMSMKPLGYNFVRVFRRFNVDANDVAMIGDQIVTDVFGARMVGMKAILVDPVSNKDNLPGKVTRNIERLLIKMMGENFIQGVYYDEM